MFIITLKGRHQVCQDKSCRGSEPCRIVSWTVSLRHFGYGTLPVCLVLWWALDISCYSVPPSLPDIGYCHHFPASGSVTLLLVKWQYSDLGAFCCNGYSVSVLPILQMSKPWLWAVTWLRWVSDELSPVSRPCRVSSSPQNSLCPILFWEMGFSFANQHATSCQKSSVHVTGSKL